MSTRNYAKLDIEPFGRQLIESGDLDPIYIALNKCEWDEHAKAAFLVAYWCCYHAGFASWMTFYSGPEFWKHLRTAAVNLDSHPAPIGGRWPRAAERRHWRGANALKSVEDLEKRYPVGPDHMLRYITSPHLSSSEQRWGTEALDTLPMGLISQRTREHSAFGPWIAFKVADMLERCMGSPISFTADDAMYEDPQEAALMVWKKAAGVRPEAEPKDRRGAINEVVNHLLKTFAGDPAPPSYDRPIGMQEVETILCKWKAHQRGHYPLFNDTHEIRLGLQPWAEISGAAREFLHHMPVADQAPAVAA